MLLHLTSVVVHDRVVSAGGAEDPQQEGANTLAVDLAIAPNRLGVFGAVGAVDAAAIVVLDCAGGGAARRGTRHGGLRRAGNR